ncbi:TIGR03435 family protein [Acidicapsa ligni]|uniref:TIGR03435 family protein n=1 Tax=Acidicapsa ligni TaxID=542300 RepID=UPI0021E0D93A|nr:TIGR03435 family protein [Acidicapsa ligni]
MIAFLLLAMTIPTWSQPRNGSHAPEIHVSKVLSPKGSDVPSLRKLRGRTIVLDFWATWCGPCIASMPHMNELVKTLDPGKFTFIAIDDEDESVTAAFLSKRTISSIVALDATKATFRSYAIDSRPATVVIDPQGNVALVTTPAKLNAQILQSISSRVPAEHGAVQAKAEPKANALSAQAPEKALKATSSSPSEDPLAEISVRRKLPDEPSFTVDHGGANYNFIGWDAKSLLEIVFESSQTPFQLVDQPPLGNFDLIVKGGKMDDEVLQTIEQAVLAEAFGMDIRKQDTQREALILVHPKESPLILLPTFDPRVSHGMEKHDGATSFTNLNMSGVADLIGRQYGMPVVDETGITGGFDGTISLPSNVDQLSEAVRKATGLEVTRGVRTITTYVATKRANDRPASSN